MNRFTKDLSSMDENLPSCFIDVIEIFLVMIGVITIVIMSNVYVIIPSVLLILSLWLIRGFYIKTARDVKRVEAISKFEWIFYNLKLVITFHNMHFWINSKEPAIHSFDCIRPRTYHHPLI